LVNATRIPGKNHWSAASHWSWQPSKIILRYSLIFVQMKQWYIIQDDYLLHTNNPRHIKIHWKKPRHIKIHWKKSFISLFHLFKNKRIPQYYFGSTTKISNVISSWSFYTFPPLYFVVYYVIHFLFK
jgi:hypothetical protein